MQRPWGRSTMWWITREQTEKGQFKGPSRSWQGLKRSQEVARGSFATLNREVALTSISAGPLQVKLISFKIPFSKPRLHAMFRSWRAGGFVQTERRISLLNFDVTPRTPKPSG